jgi:putative ABC transport system permease protein
MNWWTRLALWLHERSLPRDERDAVIGDLIEEVNRHGTDDLRVTWWIWLQTGRSLLPNLHRRLSRPVSQCEAEGDGMLNGIGTDVRFALRLMSRQPLMTVVGFVSLAVGLGLNVLLFTVADAALLRPLPLTAPGQLVLLLLQRDSGFNHNFSYPEYRDLRDGTRTLDGLVAYGSVEATLAAATGAATIDGEVVSGNFFSTLGVPMRAGRALGTIDDSRGAPPAVVIAEQFWRDRLGSADVNGQVITLNAQPYTVVGVASNRFAGMQIGRTAQFWVPLAHASVLTGGDFLDRPTTSWLTVMGRVRQAVVVATAREELDGLLRRLRQSAGRPHEPVVLQPGARGDSQLSETLTSPLLVLSMAGVFVLLVACFNVANLQLVRTDARRVELAVRSALGARQRELVRLVLIDALLIATTAGAAGVWLAALAKDRAVALIAFYGQPVALAVPLDGRAIAAALVLSCLAALIVGGISAWYGTRRRPGLIVEARTGTAPYRSAHRALVIVQVALSMALLTGGALLVRTLDRLRHADLGFNPRAVALVEVSPEMGRLSKDAAGAYFDDTIRRVSVLPGVSAAAIAHVMPLAFGGSRTSIEIEGYTPGRDEDMEMNFVRISPDYFRTLGLSILQGRPFDERDRVGQPERIIVNETMARRFWPGGRPVGRFVRFGSRQPFNVEVVGVVPDVHYRMVREDPTPSFYVPLAQWPTTAGVIHVRFATNQGVGDAASRIDELRRVVAAVNPSVPVTRAHTLLDQVERNLADERAAMTIGTTLASVALLLATAGLYATTAFLVSRRTREIGVRLALGARTTDVRSLVLTEGVRLAVLGVSGGLVLSFFVGRALEHRLYGVTATDAWSVGIAAAILAAAALLASWLPARRASRVDPVVALRES